MAIEKTVGVIESLNERIKLVEEDMAKVAAKLGSARAKNASRITRKWTKEAVRILIGLIGLIFLFSAVRVAVTHYEVESGDYFILGLGAACLAVAWFLPRPAHPILVDTASLREELASLNLRRDELKEKKRELLLRSEQEIMEETAQQAAFPHETDSTADDSKTLTKLCPMCAETVKAQARICRFCRHNFDEADS